MSVRAGLCLGLALLAAGCAVGPQYAPPATPAAGGGAFASANPEVFSPHAARPDWWRLYDDPVLDGLVRKALTQNADLKAAAANLARARGALEQARAGLFPGTTVEAGATYGKSASASQPRTGWVFDGAFDVSYEVDLFGRVRRTIEAAHADAESVAATEDLVRVTIAAETTRAYANACTSAESLAVAHRSEALARELYDLTARKRDLGASSDFEVASTGAVLDQVRAAIPSLEGQQRTALYELAVLTGDPPEVISAEAAACKTAPHLGQLLPTGDGAALLRRRPDLRRAERVLAADVARIGVAETELFPTVTLNGTASQVGSSGQQLTSSRGFSWGVGPLITWNFPNLLAAKAGVRQARAQASGDIARFQSAVLTALKEVEEALTAYASELRRNAALRSARDQSARAYQLAQVQMENGRIGFPDLLQDERVLLQAEGDLAASDQALVSDQVTVFKALGGGWETAPAVTPPKAP